ncbi:MAG: hypothetical protein D6689_12920 [Deltaproteobacteria bacterium]|nr:MAG: hypothetical protein D6689_12920 [Deltaproteobacteria bacterium]
MTRTVAIVQARAGSTRLPGKVLRPLAGAPMLAHVVARVQRCNRVDDVVVATSDAAGDDAVAEVAAAAGARVFRGSETDVLGRYAAAARMAHADRVVRITADCPLLDPAVVDDVIAALSPQVDYAANVLVRTFPRGLDAEALHADVLARLDRIAGTRPAREHVTWLIHRRPEWFKTASVTNPDGDDSDLRWTVDTEADFVAVAALYRALDLGRRLAPWREVRAYVRAHPDIAAVNAHVVQKAS